MTTTSAPDKASTTPKSDDAIREMVRDGYGQVARTASSCCGPPVEQATSCCGPSAKAADPAEKYAQHAQTIGYSAEELESAPDGANLGLGCGNPTALAELKPGETVLDLGAGAGFDAFICAEKVGPEGQVIGVDMTPEMLSRARENAVKAGVADRVEFRRGIIEDLPVTDASVDVVISNCVINLSPDKPAVFKEAFRVLKPGGRLAVSDIVLTEAIHPRLLDMAEAYVGCLAGASLADDYLGYIRDAGFVDVTFERTGAGGLFADADNWAPIAKAVEEVGMDAVKQAAAAVWSYKIRASKP